MTKLRPTIAADLRKDTAEMERTGREADKAARAVVRATETSETAKPTTDPHGTLTTTDRYDLAEGISLDVDDVMFRLLTPDEFKVGMAFARGYILSGTKLEQVRKPVTPSRHPSHETSVWLLLRL